MTEVVFLVAAVVALAAGVWTIAARTPAAAARALRVCLVAGACASVQFMAPMAAALQVVVLAGAAVIAVQAAGEGRGAPEKWGWRAGLLGLVVAVALVLVSTWARQYVWSGRELPPGSAFGTAAATGTALAGGYGPGLLTGLLVVLVAGIAGSRR